MEIDKSLIELISSIFAETMIIHQEEKQQANEPLMTSAAMSSLHTTIDADRNDSLQSNSVNVTVAVAKTPVVVKQLPASSPRNHMDDDYTSSTVLTSTTISSSAQQEDKDEPPPKILQPPLQMDEQHVLHLRSDAMAAIVRCYNQVVCYEESSLPITKIPTAIQSNTTTDCPSISTFLLVTGPTGAGKTKLVQYSLQDLVRQRGGYYIRGKFDMLQHPDPYQAYVSAFTDFTFQVLQRGPDQVRAMRDAIHEACSTETCVLVQMIPALSTIINFQDDCVTTSTTDDNVVTTTTIQSDVSPSNHQYHNDDAAIQRFVFVLQTFLRAVSSLEQPIILLLDDLQWSDPSSVDVMCSVLTNSTKSPGLFVVGTYNGDDDMEHDDLHDETKETSYLWRKLREMKIISNGLFVVQTVPIHDFDMDQVKYVLKRTLQQGSLIDLQIDDSLSSIVMKETNGNLFLMIEFLKWLCGVGLLTTNCPQNCGMSFTYWTWSVDDINLAILDRLKVCATNDSKYYVSHKLEQLPMEMIDVLKVGAYFGDSHMEGKIIEYVLDYPVSPMLSQAVDMGILTASNSDDGGVKMYSFEHDSLQMAVYNMVPESNRELFHLEIGRRLWRRLRKDELDHYIFVVLSHMIVGQRLITRPTERYSIASLCLHAGKKAANMSNFQVASIYLNFGVQLLGDRGWRDEYDLSLMSYNAAAEMEIFKANFEGMEALIESIFRNSRCFEDKIQAKTSQIYALGVNDRQQDGLDLGIQLLTDLGTPLPKSFSKFVLRIDLNAVQKLLRGKSNDYLKRLPVIEDRDILASLHVLNLMFLHALLVRPWLSPFITLKLMKLTMTHGLSFLAPLTFATYGMLCIRLSDRDAALRYGELGLELLEKFQVREYIARVFAAYYACIYPWKYRARDGLDRLLYAHRAGLQTGDVEFSCLCANLWSYIAIDCGLPLDAIELQWTNFQGTMKSHRQASLFRGSVPCLQAIQFYQGKNVDFSETEALWQYCIDNKIRSTANGIRWSRAKTAFLFQDMDRADELVYDANVSKNGWSIPPTPEIVHVTFLNGMVAFAMVNYQSRDKTVRPKRRTRRQYINEGKSMIRSIKKYAHWCPANFLDKKFLLKAELAAVSGQSDKAMEQYISAIALAKDNRNLFVQALANERAGRYCYTVLHQSQEAVSYFLQALFVYAEWAAHRKVDHLRAELKTMYSPEDYNKWFL